jgi:hypothetical protein
MKSCSLAHKIFNLHSRATENAQYDLGTQTLTPNDYVQLFDNANSTIRLMSERELTKRKPLKLLFSDGDGLMATGRNDS